MTPGVILHYEILRKLGSGGMGEVFLAEDLTLDREVALKLLPKDYIRDAARRGRFLEEAKAASALNHPNVCTIYEVEETPEGQLFIAMEYVDGQGLDVLARHRRLEISEIAAIGAQVADALEAARQRQIVHRDIKPGNIMLSARGRVKVVDFGVAKRQEQDSAASTLTQDTSLIGTPNYLNPEMALGHEADCRSDIFSLGIVLYELAAGRHPFAGASFGDTINNILHQEPASLRPWNPKITAEFERVVLKCLQKAPAGRYQTPAELHKDLAQLQHALGHSKLTQRLAVASVILALSLAAISVSWLLGSKSGQPGVAQPSKRIASLAVKPLDDFSGDTNNAYLTDGMTEALCSALGRIGSLRVPGRSSVMRFKGSAKSIQEIAQELKVDAILEGSIQRNSNRIRVTAQLIEANSDRHVWAMTYDRDLSDFFVLQDQVARAIANEIQVRVTPKINSGVAQARSVPSQAIEAYLKGRYLWNRRTGEALSQAIECFNEAIGADPNYALAYAGLADCYCILTEYAGIPLRDSLPKARAAALKAIELDPALAEPHATLAVVKKYIDHDWAGAEEEFLKAIALNPNYATAHHWYAILLQQCGRPQEALTEIRRAQELDPLSPVINVKVADILFSNGQHELSFSTLQNLITIDPKFVVAHAVLGRLYLEKGRFAEALPHCQATHELMSRESNDPAYGLDILGYAYARNGRTNEARQVLADMLELQKRCDLRVGIAWVQHALGDDEAAIKSLGTAWEEQAVDLDVLYWMPSWQSFRPHPQVKEILTRINLVK